MKKERVIFHITNCFRNQENKDSPRVKRSRTDDVGHLLNQNITSDIVTASPTVIPFSLGTFLFLSLKRRKLIFFSFVF